MGDESNSKIKVIGTHHFQEEKEIREHIDSFNPDIILLELCNGRITLINNPNLKQKEKFSILGLISKSIKKKAEKEGKEYGSDLKSAYKIAREKNIPVGLIDRPLVETNLFFKAIPLREKIILLNELRKFSSKDIQIQDILNEVESTKTEDILKQVKGKCPELFYYLISSRDEYMINKIKGYLYDNPSKKILIFVGKGHEETIKKNLKLDAEVVKGGDKK
jgi:pheromone shutdown protein TraB